VNESFFNAGLQARYLATFGNVYVMPFVRAAEVTDSRAAFAEGGAGSLDIAYAGFSGNVSSYTGGIRTGYNGQGNGYVFQPWVELSGTGFAGKTNIAVRETIGTVSATQFAQAAPSGIGGLGVGVNFIRNHWSGNISYQGQFADGTSFNTFTASVKYRW
jgi:hypothetical protein